MSENYSQVWSWNSLQRSTDSLMNKAYILACKRLVQKSIAFQKNSQKILDVGAGSGLVLRHLSDVRKDDYEYTGIDLNKDGLERLLKRAENLGIKNKVITYQDNISVYNNNLSNTYDLIFSNFCLYTISNQAERFSALKNIADYLNKEGFFFISLPSERYSAFNIALQCFKDEISDDQNLSWKFLRAFLLVPYQWEFVLKPIEAKVNKGMFIRFTKEQIFEEFKEAGLEILNINTDYGDCGYHLIGRKK